MSEYIGEQLQLIQQWLEDRGELAFRFTQIREAWYRVGSWDEVTVLPKKLREELAAEFEWISVRSEVIKESQTDGTKKTLLILHDGEKIESVFMPNARGKRTICVSSQVGCAMKCTFCATGTMGLKRNLSIDEIVDQIRFWKFAQPGEEISNVVFMGMGEPLANFDVVKAAAWIMVNELGLGSTRVTVSTVGVIVGLKKLMNDPDFPPVRIAFSLHAGTDETRGSIVPTHKASSLQKIEEWVEEYLNVRGNRRHHLTFEYVMLSGVNDMLSEAEAFGKRFGRFGSKLKLNLIPWNPTGTHLERSRHEHIEAFRAICERYGVKTTIRYSKGLDIEAACGQLVVSQKEKKEAEEKV